MAWYDTISISSRLNAKRNPSPVRLTTQCYLLNYILAILYTRQYYMISLGARGFAKD